MLAPCLCLVLVGWYPIRLFGKEIPWCLRAGLFSIEKYAMWIAGDGTIMERRGVLNA